jgi:ribA/ribD-fused uncharacterized protein
MQVIDRFDGEHRFLSNFLPEPVVFARIEYPTVEHAFQAAKTHDRALKLAVTAAPSPGAAKRMGRKLPLRADWERVKTDIMRTLVRLKFSTHQELRELLLATREARLIEENTWDDTFWGVCKGKGQNWLGRILMEVREELVEVEVA